jgi:hypothetical protein
MVTQLLLKLAKPGAQMVVAVDNPTNRPPISFEDRAEHIRIPRFGTQDLASLAEFAVRSGFGLEEFEIVDATMTRLDADYQTQVSDELVAELTHVGVDAAIDLLLRKYPTFGIIGIVLRTPDDRGLTIRRNGVVEFESGVSPIDLVSDAWHTLHFA